MRRSRADALAALVVTVALAGAPAARAQTPAVKPEAQPHFERALRHYQAREYLEAAAAIEAAHAIDPKPDLLYMWAQSKRLGGDCASAIPLYRRYLETVPGERQAELAQRHLSRCETVVAAAPQPAGAPPAQPSPPIVIVQAPPPAPPRAPWYRDSVGNVLAGSGVVALGAAGALEYSARTALQSALDASSYDDHARNADAARTRHRLAAGALALGSALIVAGVVHYLLRR